jgi:hypothetical protein
MAEVSRRSLLKGAAVAAVAAGGVGGLVSARVAKAAPANKVTRNGTQLLLNGQPYRMVGFGMWPMAVSSWCHPGNYDGRSVADLPKYLADIGKTAPHLNSIRVWFFQQFALNGGSWDYSGFDACLSAADAAGFKVIACLEDNWSYERTQSHNPALDTAWFNGGYKNSVLTKEKVPYRQYVQQVVTRYAGDPRISFWELGNEMNAITTSFADDVSGLIKSIDSAALVSTGGVGTSSSILALPTIDAGCYHYYTDYGQTGWQSVQQAAASAGKPWYLGEYGVSTTGSARANSVSSLLSSVFADSNSAGVLYWQYSETGGDVFKVGAGDPVLPVLDQYVRPAAPPPGPSPSPSAVLPAPANPSDLNKEVVKWDAVSGAHHYSLQLLQGGKVVRDRTTKGRSWSWTPLKAGVTYQWQVAAVTSGGKVGTYTAPRSFTAGRDA